MLLIWIIIVICVFTHSDSPIYTTKQLYYIPVYLYYKATNRPKLSSWARISISWGEDWVVKQQTQPLPQMVMFGCLMTLVVKSWSMVLSSWTGTQHFDIPVTLLYIQCALLLHSCCTSHLLLLLEFIQLDYAQQNIDVGVVKFVCRCNISNSRWPLIWTMTSLFIITN